MHLPHTKCIPTVCICMYVYMFGFDSFVTMYFVYSTNNRKHKHKHTHTHKRIIIVHFTANLMIHIAQSNELLRLHVSSTFSFILSHGRVQQMWLFFLHRLSLLCIIRLHYCCWLRLCICRVCVCVCVFVEFLFHAFISFATKCNHCQVLFVHTRTQYKSTSMYVRFCIVE